MLWPRPHVRGRPFDLQRREGWDLVGTRFYFKPARVTYFFRNVWAWMEDYQGNWEDFAWLYHKKKKKKSGISKLLPQCWMTFPHTALQDSILRLPTMIKCLEGNKNQLTSSIFDLNIIKISAILLSSMIYPLRKTRQRQMRRTVNKDKDKPK